MRLLVTRWLSVVLLVSAVATGHPRLLYLAAAVLLLVGYRSTIQRGRFLRNLAGLPRLRADAPGEEEEETLPGVTVISPARNEEESIEAATRSRAALDYPDLEVIVVDDHSTDRTGAILDRLAGELPGLRVLHHPPLREGWFGKSSAIWHGVQAGDPGHEWLLLCDADVMFEPPALWRAVALAEAGGLDFLTCLPWLELGSVSEQLYLPHGWRNIIAAASPDRLQDPQAFPVGLGAFSLVRRRAYLESGGHAAFQGRHPEDTLVAAVVKRWGGRMGVAWTSDLLRLRFYVGYEQLRSYSVRKTRIICNDRLAFPLANLATWLLAAVLPLPLGLIAIAQQLFWTGFDPARTCVAAAGLLTCYSVVREYDRVPEICAMRPALAWAHPLGGLLGSWLSLLAVVGILSRRKMEWRGRPAEVVRR